MDRALEEVVARVTDQVAKSPDLQALLLVGSTARGDRSEGSDIDFLALMKNESPWSVAVRDGGRHSWMDPSGFQIEIGYASVRRVRERMRVEADAGMPWRLQLFTEGRLLAGGGTEYERLVAEAEERYQQGPPQLTDQQRHWEGFDAWCRLRRLDAARDADEAALLGFDLLQQLIRLACRLAGVWQARSKDALQRISEVDGEIARLARDFLGAHGMRERTQILHRIAERLADQHDLELSGDYKSAPS